MIKCEWVVSESKEELISELKESYKILNRRIITVFSNKEIDELYLKTV